MAVLMYHNGRSIDVPMPMCTCIHKHQHAPPPPTASTGSDNKVEALRGLGFDHVFNYKTTEVGAALDKAAPDGIDVYWVRFTGGGWGWVGRVAAGVFHRFRCIYLTTPLNIFKSINHTA